jgi:hypothetical protein
MRETRKKATTRLPGKASLFRNKVRAPVTITLTKGHHAKVKKAMRRLGLTRADLLGLLIEQYADTITLPRAKGSKRDAS